MQSIPTVYAFVDGRPVDGFAGAQPESAIKAFVERLIGDGDAADLEVAIAEGDKAFEEGDLQTAAEIFASVLQEEADNVKALAGLARCYLKTGDLERAEQTLASRRRRSATRRRLPACAPLWRWRSAARAPATSAS